MKEIKLRTVDFKEITVQLSKHGFTYKLIENRRFPKLIISTGKTHDGKELFIELLNEGDPWIHLSLSDSITVEYHGDSSEEIAELAENLTILLNCQEILIQDNYLSKWHLDTKVFINSLDGKLIFQRGQLLSLFMFIFKVTEDVTIFKSVDNKA